MKEPNFICPICGQAKYFRPSKLKGKTFCSQACKNILMSQKLKGDSRLSTRKKNPDNYVTCKHCGKEFYKVNNTRNIQFCSNECRLNNYRKDGKRIKGEYIQIFLKSENKWVYEHRYIMEQQLGRKLSTAEEVHHINEDKLDNRVENLVVLSKAEHTRIHHLNKKKGA